MCSHCNGGNYDEPAEDHGQHGEPAGKDAFEALRHVKRQPHFAIEEGRELVARPTAQEAQVDEGMSQQFIENAKQRIERNSWRRANQGSKLLLDALRKNGDAKL